MSVISRAVETRRRRLLFIEDHTELLATYERVFRHHEIVLVESGEAALDTLRRQDNFDLIVCDLVLPGIDGIEVFKRARVISPEIGARFVFATGSNNRQLFQQSLETMDVPVLEKPFGMALLRELVERAGKR
ncbi:MAG: response regulator [Kofleriaceae bacterium]